MTGLFVAVRTGHSAGRLFADVMPWVLALIGAALLGAVAIYMVRRLMRRAGDSAAGFTLHDLRELHAAGEITADEFARAKSAMIDRIKADTEQPGDQTDTSSGLDTSP